MLAKRPFDVEEGFDLMGMQVTKSKGAGKKGGKAKGCHEVGKFGGQHVAPARVRIGMRGRMAATTRKARVECSQQDHLGWTGHSAQRRICLTEQCAGVGELRVTFVDDSLPRRVFTFV